MKQNVRNLKQQKIYRRRRTVLAVILVALVVLIVAIYATNTTPKMTAEVGNNIDIKGLSIDLSKVISVDPNPPALGAGMIPIKWDENIKMWVITTANDKDWYDYSKGKWANVMLSDGKYSSELERGKILADVGNGALVVPDDELGTIFTWIPRLTYLDTRVEYLKGNSILEYKWTTESCFNLEKYGANGLDLAFSGIWVGQTEYKDLGELEAKNEEMRKEENKQGLIANEMVLSITESEKTAVQKLYQKTVGNDTLVVPHTILQNPEEIQNRQVIKIVNTNNRIPLVGVHEISGDYIVIKAKYAENQLAYTFNKNEEVLTLNRYEIDEKETNYTFYLVDNIGNIRRYKMSYGSGRPDVTKFNPSNTFYVLYDEEGNENSLIPVGEKLTVEQKQQWYNYDEQKWANIVVRDNGCETYYVWIPRYMYKITDTENQRVDAKFVDLSNVWTDETGKEINLNNTEYKLPEAFTWEDPDNPNDKIQLTGFWTSKYKLQGREEYSPEISGGAGVIRINNILAHYGEEYKYEMYLIKDGKRVIQDGENLIERTEPIELKGNYVFKGITPGYYTVNIAVIDAEGNYIKSIANEVLVREGSDPEKPDLTGFNPNLTYYVTYDDEGFEESNIPINDVEPEDWYDYDEQRWANIVVRENGYENYYVWIPRYEYTIDSNHEKTNIQFIKVNEMAETGYTIPEAFSWENPENPDEKIQLPGFWASKYKLRDDTVYNLSASVTAVETSVKVSGFTPKTEKIPTTYEVSLIENGKIVKTEKVQNVTNASCLFENLKSEETYAINVIALDEAGKMISGYSTEVTLVGIEIDLSTFNKNTTFYVTYDDNGNESSIIPIGEPAPKNWSDYASQKWANIVVRDNGCENYYVWIPRYEYVLNEGEQKTKVVFTSKDEPTPGYTIPEAFTWENPEKPDEKIQLPGFWVGKYKLSDREEYEPEISGGAGVIRVNNILAHYGSDYKYEMYLIQNGVRIKNTANSPIPLTDNSYIIENLEEGTYSVNVVVKDSAGNYVRSITNEVYVRQGATPEKPDLTGFNENLTFYVTYNSLGQEESYIPIKDEPPENWYNYNASKWANIVVRENGYENYYVWIPRYEYALDSNHEKTDIQFIDKNVIKADSGYTIPEAFTWENPKNPNEKVQLSGFWANKYKLRDGEDATALRLDASITTSGNKIKVSNIIATDTTYNNYTAYLIKNGKIKQTQSLILGGDYTFIVDSEGTYSVEIVQHSATAGIIAGVAKEIEVKQIDPPDVTGFRVDTTYIVSYNSDGTENRTKLADVLEAGATINDDQTLKSGKIDINEVNGWYDYTDRKWANIVTVNDGIENYYVWIPRYEYVIGHESEQKTAVKLLRKDEMADTGYVLPEAFTWKKEDGTVEQLSGFWASKYKLREQ